VNTECMVCSCKPAQVARLSYASAALHFRRLGALAQPARALRADSYEVAGAHVVMLGSYAPYLEDSAQYAWLRRDLASVDRGRTPWLIAAMHAPWRAPRRSWSSRRARPQHALTVASSRQRQTSVASRLKLAEGPGS